MPPRPQTLLPTLFLQLHLPARSLRTVRNPLQQEPPPLTLTNLPRPTNHRRLLRRLLHLLLKKNEVLHRRVPRKNRRPPVQSQPRKPAGNLHHQRSKPRLHLRFMETSKILGPRSVGHESPLPPRLRRFHRRHIDTPIEERKHSNAEQRKSLRGRIAWCHSCWSVAVISRKICDLVFGQVVSFRNHSNPMLLERKTCGPVHDPVLSSPIFRIATAISRIHPFEEPPVTVLLIPPKEHRLLVLMTTAASEADRCLHVVAVLYPKRIKNP